MIVKISNLNKILNIKFALTAKVILNVPFH